MKAMRSLRYRWTPCQVLKDEGNAEKNKNRTSNNETNWPVLRPVAAVLLQIWIIDSYERIKQHKVGVFLQIWNVFTFSCSGRIDPYTVP